MPSLQLFLLFLAADAALKLTPGPDMALTLSRGMTQGFRPAFHSVLGNVAAGFIQVPAVVLGLASVLRAFPALFVGIKAAGRSVPGLPGHQGDHPLRAIGRGVAEHPPGRRPRRLLAGLHDESAETRRCCCS